MITFRFIFVTFNISPSLHFNENLIFLPLYMKFFSAVVHMTVKMD